MGNYKVTYRDIMEAEYFLAGVVHRTPLQLSHTFSQMTGCSVYLKLENLQKTGAFKIRGAFNKVAHLSPDERLKGIVTASAGNHAQGVALAAQKYEIPATVVMPEGAPEAKIQATEGYGSTVVLSGKNYDESYQKAQQICEEQGATFVHAFDDPQVIAGQGTVGLELMEELPYVDAVIVPVGGGGLISGIAIAAKTVNPQVQIIGVQPDGSNSGFLSWKNGEIEKIDKPASIADGLSVKAPGKLPFQIMRKYVDQFITVSDAEIEHAMYLFLERCKVLVEGAGATTLAALLSLKHALQKQTVALVVSGGNVDISRLTAITQRHAHPGPIHV